MWAGLAAKDKGLVDQVATVFQLNQSMSEHYKADIDVTNKKRFSWGKLVSASTLAQFFNEISYEMGNSSNNFN